MALVTTKKCTGCQQIKPISDFYRKAAAKDGHTPSCKSCNNKRATKYAKSHRKQTNEASRRYRQKHPEVAKKYRESISREIRRNYELTHLYGLSIKEWEAKFEKQQGCCALCGVHQSEVNRTFDTDHNHITDEVRELLCRRCNLLAGTVENNLELVYKILTYLEKH